MSKLIIANWKMQLSYSASLALAKKMVERLPATKQELVICPDYLALPVIAKTLSGSRLQLGAQDSAMTDFGAATGEVSPANLKKLGVKYVILGHSERREHLHESSLVVNAKIKAALVNKLIPVVCIGEKLEERKAGQTKDWLSEQLRHSLKGVKIKKSTELVIAYEPIWAIGNGQAMESGEAQVISLFIQQRASKMLHYPVRVIYGGSVSAVNANQFLASSAISGLLVGGASLNLTEFSKICS
jgi:triosephosphate isomerase